MSLLAGYPGVYPGGLTSEKEAMILVCFLIDRTAVPINEDNILNIITATRVANYFDTASAIQRLLEKMNIMHDKDGSLQLTPTGSRIADVLSSTLPRSVIDDSLDGLRAENIMQRNLDDNDFIITEKDRGLCDITLAMHENDRVFFSMTMSGFNKNQAHLMQKRFYKNPAALYQTCLKLLLNYDPQNPAEPKE